MITAETITDDQLRAIRDLACECRPYLPIESDDHAAIHDCDMHVYDDAVTALEAIGEEAYVSRANCALILNNPGPHYAKALNARKATP